MIESENPDGAQQSMARLPGRFLLTPWPIIAWLLILSWNTVQRKGTIKMYILDKANIIQKFHELDVELGEMDIKRKLGMPPSIVLIGGAGLILKYRLKRATADIDILHPLGETRFMGGLGALLAAKGFHVVSESLLLLHPHYEERLKSILDLKNFNVYTLDAHDYAITKIGRCSEKDIDDVILSRLLDGINIEKLKEMYFDAMTYWVGDERRFRGNWETFRRRLDQHLRQ